MPWIIYEPRLMGNYLLRNLQKILSFHPVFMVFTTMKPRQKPQNLAGRYFAIKEHSTFQRTKEFVSVVEGCISTRTPISTCGIYASVEISASCHSRITNSAVRIARLPKASIFPLRQMDISLRMLCSSMFVTCLLEERIQTSKFPKSPGLERTPLKRLTRNASRNSIRRMVAANLSNLKNRQGSSE